VRPLYAPAWTAVAWLAAALGRPDAGALVTGTGTALLARRLARVTGEGWPRPVGSAAWRLAVRQAAGGTLAAARPLGSAVSRTWWPVALPAAIAVRRLRLPLAALVLAPPLLDWLDRRPPLDPARYVAARLLDDAGYSVGVWQGCMERRTVRPLLPLLRGRDRPGHHLCRPRLNSAGTMMSSEDSSWIEDRPSASSVESMPPRRTSKTFFTPAEPFAASPHR
jgi:mycofactocin glycosyltransferase